MTCPRKARSLDIIHGACRACSAKLKAADAVEKEGIPLIKEMSGHPAMADFIAEGYEVITFLAGPAGWPKPAG
jgi:hypothetical protein